MNNDLNNKNNNIDFLGDEGPIDASDEEVNDGSDFDLDDDIDGEDEPYSANASGDDSDGNSSDSDDYDDDDEPYRAERDTDDTDDVESSDDESSSDDGAESNDEEQPSEEQPSDENENPEEKSDGEENKDVEEKSNSEDNKEGEEKPNSEENKEGEQKPEGEEPKDGETKQEPSGETKEEGKPEGESKEQPKQDDEKYKANKKDQIAQDGKENAKKNKNEKPKTEKPKPDAKGGNGKDNFKDKIDKANKNMAEKQNQKNKGNDGKKDDGAKNGGDKEGDSKGGQDKKDAKGGIANPTDAAKQALENKKEDIKKKGKRDVLLGNKTSKDAMQYAAIAPKEYGRDVAKQKVLSWLSKLPKIVWLYIAIGILIILIVLTLMLGLASPDPSGGDTINKFDYSQVKVEIDNEGIWADHEYSLEEYAIGATYTEFFIRHKPSDYKNEDGSIFTKEQFKNAFTSYLLYAKTTALKDGYDPSDDDYLVEMSEYINDYPSFCDPFVGCEETWGAWGDWYERFERDEDDPEKKPEHEGFSGIESGTLEGDLLDLLFSVSSENDGKILSPSDKNDVITSIDDDYPVPSLDKDLYESIIEKVKEKKDGITIIKEVAKEEDESYDVKLYAVSDYIIDEKVAYFDIGFWWPVGSNECTKNENGKLICSGTPVTTHISSPFGYRILTVNGQDHSGHHGGIDISSGVENDVTPIIAVYDGTVDYIGCTRHTDSKQCGDGTYAGGGCQIWITHTNGLVTKYLHLTSNSYNAYVQVGDKVVRGQQIARMGTTGCSTGTHLHFEIHEDGAKINPRTYVSPNNTRPTK